MPEVNPGAENSMAVPEAGRKSSHTGLVLVIVVALIAAGTGLWWGLVQPGRENGAAKKGETGIKAVLHLESFLVNLADPEQNRFLRVSIELGLEKELPREENATGGLPMARIRDTVLSVATTWQSSALLAPEGKTKLKEALLAALRQRLPGMGIREIYFTDFLVQL